MSNVAALRAALEKVSDNGVRVFSAPGRVNLIGEHTDYNEGFVLPIAIDRRTFVAAARRVDRRVHVRSFNLGEDTSFSLEAEHTSGLPRWGRYVEGVARVLDEELEGRLCGLDMAIESDVPIGAGLSSSAALEISVGIAFLAASESVLDLQRLAVAAQRAEQIYAGTKCGLMDQLAVAFGEKDHALLIDCRTLEIKPIELNIPQYEIVVCNTNVKHDLATSAYNERRAECELGVSLLREGLPNIQSLRDVTSCEFEEFAGPLPEKIARRCRHVITENDRTLRAASALSEGNTKEFGNLMVQSHRSLRDDFEVSSEELDAMVEIAMSYETVAGARMTGGGFGGCTVNLVRCDKVDDFRKFVAEAYQRRTGITPHTYLVHADVGVQEVQDQ
jgi:galactokinase